MTIQSIHAPETLQVPPTSTVESARNVTILPGQDNLLLANITITNQSGSLSSLRFQLLAGNNTRPCDSAATRILADEEVSNSSLGIPLARSGVYCFVFDNLGSSILKNVRAATSIQSSFVQVKVNNDGGLNMAGLGISTLGLFVTLVGFSRKTVIPWE